MVREWRRLKKINDGVYVGEADSEHPQARVFGGHVLAQAMSAAYYTAPEGFRIHSVHCYFIRGGEEAEPIEYTVKQIRDGRNFAVRQLDSIKDRFTMTPAFPQNVPAPETLKSNLEGRNELIMHGVDARDIRGQYTERMAPCVEVRPCNLDHYLNGTNGVNEKQYVWFKYKLPVDADDFMHKQATLVYMSDIGPVITGSLCHKDKRFKLSTSLDHSTWFHQYSDWILYETECIASTNYRSLVNGKMWSRDGRLLMSTSQEALIYTIPDSKL